jgi:hypothetical protein
MFGARSSVAPELSPSIRAPPSARRSGGGLISIVRQLGRKRGAALAAGLSMAKPEDDPPPRWLQFAAGLASYVIFSVLFFMWAFFTPELLFDTSPGASSPFLTVTVYFFLIFGFALLRIIATPNDNPFVKKVWGYLGVATLGLGVCALIYLLMSIFF